jgi:aminopeptidase N
VALDALNPQVVARLARVLERWRAYAPHLLESMHRALMTVPAQVRSRDVIEVVGKALA